MTKTLFVSDMDGTLLNADAKLSERTSRIITELTDAGAYITVATARTPATVQNLLSGTRFRLPAIVMTGAALWHTDTQVFSDVRFIPADQYAAIDEAYARAGVCPFIYTLGDGNILQVYYRDNDMNPAERQFVDERRHLTLKHFNIGALPPAHSDNRRMLQFAMGPEDVMRNTAEVLRSATDCQVTIYRDTYTDAWILEVFAPGVSKAEAITRMKERIDADRVVVYGDNLNDLPMMKIADVSIVVDNALPQVKAAADYVIGPHTADAVALSMQALFNA